jgi:hypothetical protein
MPQTTNREHGEQRLPDGLIFEQTSSPPTEEGGVRYDVSGEFQMKDAHGVFKLRDYGYRRTFMLMGA